MEMINIAGSLLLASPCRLKHLKESRLHKFFPELLVTNCVKQINYPDFLQFSGKELKRKPGCTCIQI
jgi:hypothetical protein